MCKTKREKKDAARFSVHVSENVESRPCDEEEKEGRKDSRSIILDVDVSTTSNVQCSSMDSPDPCGTDGGSGTRRGRGKGTEKRRRGDRNARGSAKTSAARMSKMCDIRNSLIYIHTNLRTHTHTQHNTGGIIKMKIEPLLIFRRKRTT